MTLTALLQQPERQEAKPPVAKPTLKVNRPAAPAPVKKANKEVPVRRDGKREAKDRYQNIAAYMEELAAAFIHSLKFANHTKWSIINSARELFRQRIFDTPLIEKDDKEIAGIFISCLEDAALFEGAMASLFVESDAFAGIVTQKEPHYGYYPKKK